ncbi:MAG: hypothetical protein ACLTCB_00610 [Merdibacter sp.]
MTFSKGSGEPAVRDVDLVIRRTETIGIIGGTSEQTADPFSRKLL